MPDSDEQREIKRLRNELARAQKEINQIWSQLKRRSTGTGSVERVNLALANGNGGSQTTPCNFTYNFTDSTGIAHNAMSPSHQRLFAAKKATKGAYDRLNNELFLTDEQPDGGGCA